MSKNLSEELVRFVDNLSEDSKATVYDFFEHCGIPEEQRSDFVFAAIANGAMKIQDSRAKTTTRLGTLEIDTIIERGKECLRKLKKGTELIRVWKEKISKK